MKKGWGIKEMGKDRILIVEDDEDIREGVRMLLEGEGYQVQEAPDGRSGLRLLDGDTDLVILDVMMPGLSGLKTCEEIRKNSNVPVLFLTAKAQESDKLIGLMTGGDDYLTKPFSYSELLGRVKALLRRYRVYKGKEMSEKPETEPERSIGLGGISIIEKYNEVRVDGREVCLTDNEYKILLLLIKHPGIVFSVQKLYESIWEEPYFYSCSNTVMVHIRKLRLKIEKDPQNPKRVVTVWGKGYRFERNGE